MGKILRPILQIAAIAVQFIPGVGQLARLAITAGLTLLNVALAPKAPKVSPSTRDRLYATIDPSAPRKILFGSTALATDIRYEEWNGTNQEYLDRIIAVASHKIQSIEEIWIEDRQAWTSGGGVTSTFSGYLTVTTRTEGNSGNTIPINGGGTWGTSCRLTGCAYVHMRFKVTGNSKKAESPFSGGIPQRLTVIGKGALLYDPRLDSTVGGSGSQRANDQSTWGWTSDTVGNNPALQLLFYLLGWKIGGKLAVGRGIPPARINMASFIAAANICEESVTLAAGGTEKRYRSAGIVSEADSPTAVLEILLASCAGTLRDASGSLALDILHNDLASPVAAFTDDDILGEFNWQPNRSLEESFNVVRGRRTDPSANALYQLVDYPAVSLTSPDGLERIHTLELSMVQSASQAQRLAKQELQRAQYQGTFSAEFKASAWKCQVGDVVTQTFSPLGFSTKLFRILEQTIRMDGVCAMLLREENAAIYAWSAEETAAVTPAAPIVYDYLNNPFLPVESITGNLTNESVTLAADAAGTVSSFATAAGVFKVFDGLVDVTTSATFSEVSETNCTGTINATTGAYSVTAMSADAAEYKVRAVYNGVTIDKIFSLAKSRAGSNGSNGSNGATGATGATGNTFKRIYKRSATAPSTPSGNMTPSGWSTTIPADDGNPVYASDAEISGADGTTLVGSWSTPVIFQATTPVSASETQTLTSQSEMTAAIKRTLPNGGSLSVSARFRSGTTAGSGTQTFKTEYRVAGGSWTTLTTVNQSYVPGEVITLNASGTITNSSGFEQAYEVRAVATVSGGGGETVVENRSFITA